MEGKERGSGKKKEGREKGGTQTPQSLLGEGKRKGHGEDKRGAAPRRDSSSNSSSSDDKHI